MDEKRDAASNGEDGDSPKVDENGEEILPPTKKSESLAKQRKQAEKMASLREKSSLKRGDYVVQCHVIEGRELQGRGDGDSFSDPVCEVTCMGKTFHTRTVKKAASVIFDEIFYFEFADVDPKQLVRERLSINVFDKNAIRRNVMIGAYEFGLEAVYYADHHEVYKQWVALDDPTDEYEGIQGYLRVSVSVLGPGDQPYVRPPQEDEEDQNGGMLTVLLAPKIKQKKKLLKIKIFEGHELPRMDTLSWCDPFVVADFANTVQQTTVINLKKQGVARWNEEISIPVIEPIMGSRITLRVLDHDSGPQKNDTISTFDLNYDRIKSEGPADLMSSLGSDGLQSATSMAEPRWYCMYGAPHQKDSSKVAKRMNAGYDEGSCYRGRVLIAATVEDSKEPKKGVAKGFAAPSIPDETLYVIQCDLFEVSDVQKDKSTAIEIACGAESMKSPTRKPKNGSVKWHEALDSDKNKGANGLSVRLPKDREQCPDIFVYLVLNKDRVSFARFKFDEVFQRGWAVPPTWNQLTHDSNRGSLPKGRFPGSVLLSLRCGFSSQAPKLVDPVCRPFSGATFEIDGGRTATPSAPSSGRSTLSRSSMRDTEKATFKEVVQSEIPEVGDLHVWVYDASGIPAADKNGKSDPYVKLEVGSKSFKTEVVKKTLKPKWTKDQPFIFKNVKAFDDALELEVWDDNALFQVNKKLTAGKLRLRDVLRKDGNDIATGPTYERELSHYPSVVLSGAPKNLLPELRLKVRYEGDPNKRAKKSLLQKLSINTGGSSKEAPSSRCFGKPAKSTFQLRAYIYLARNLAAADFDGQSDPYVQVHHYGHVLETSHKNNTLNPSWFSTEVMNIELPCPLSLAPDIRGIVFDHDKVVFTHDVALGYFNVSCDDAHEDNVERLEEPEPKWYELSDSSGGPAMGEVLASFQLVPIELARTHPVPSINPKTKKQFLQVATLGLRNLKSKVGVHNPFMRFLFDGVDEHGTQPSCDPSPENPNFLSVARIEADIPINPLFAPSVQIHVQDMLFGGLIKRTLGFINIPMAFFMEEFAERRAVMRQKKAERIKRASEDGGGGDDGAKIEVVVDDEKEEKTSYGSSLTPASASAAGPASRSPSNSVRRPNTAVSAQGSLQEEAGESKSREKKSVDSSSVALNTTFAATGKKPSSSRKKSRKSNDDSVKTPLLLEHKSDEPSVSQKRSNSSDSTDGELAIDIPDELDENGNPIRRPRLSTMGAQDMQNQAFNADDITAEEEDIEPVDEVPEYMKGRATCPNELGQTHKIEPFFKSEIFSGKETGSMFGGKRRSIGSYKGVIKLTGKRGGRFFDKVIEQMMKPSEVVVRVYILRALQLIPRDRDGSNDPFLTIEMGKHKISTRDHHFNNTTEPEFYESFELRTAVPGDTRLRVCVWDWDGIGDDVIGETFIDVEDRWFSQEWKKLEPKPLERRTLKIPSMNAPQGVLEMWLDIMTPEEASMSPMLNIKPPPPEPFELRVIIWSVEDVPVMDETTQQNDLYVTGVLDQGKEGSKLQKTDVHYRAKEGKGNFNWRLVFPIELPSPKGSPAPRLRLQIWDRDLFSANDAVCEANISLAGLFRKAHKSKVPQTVRQRNKDGVMSSEFWIENMPRPNGPPSDARIKMSVEVLPVGVAKQLPAGLGRSDPNANPFLPEPEGRLKFEGPISFLKDLMGKELFGKICKPLAACGTILLVIVVAIFILSAFQFIPL